MAEARKPQAEKFCTQSPSLSIPLKRQHDSVILLPVEQLLRQLLLDYRDEVLAKDSARRLDIWFTGGWVRDKLLGVQSMDIDAALSTMTGVQFGEGLESFYSKNRLNYIKEAERIQVSSTFKLYKVDKKPEKSKHLETGTAHIFGLDVDFVNLRGETYTEESRNPQMDFATAEEDAFRRDATVNAIFYNVETQQVADFTGKGLEDMAAGIMRTPLEPSQTFMDDPLRVLRLVRFASRLGYTIADDAKQSMKDERIHAALNVKVSRERIGIEVFKMINGRDPLMSFELIHELGLYATVFLGDNSHSTQLLMDSLSIDERGMPWPLWWPRSYRLLTSLMQDTTILTELIGTQEYVWLIAAYAPVAPLRKHCSKQAVKDATDAMKLTRIHSKLLEESLMHMDDIRAKVELAATHNETDTELSRSIFGMAIRSWGAHWRLQVLFSLLGESCCKEEDDKSNRARLGRYSTFLHYICQQNLQDAHSMKLILDGDDVKRIFCLSKSGPFMKKALEGIAKWQFDNENGSRDDAIMWLRGQREALAIP